MNESATETFNDSLERCLAHDDFLERFYVRFLDSAPEVRAAFANTDFARQARMLRASLYLMMSMQRAGTRITAQLERLAERHNKLGVRQMLYGLWLETLIRTVREVDTRFDPDVEFAWRAMLAPGIKFMKRDAPP
jgi:hemoglobin-like flavoprotein